MREEDDLAVSCIAQYPLKPIDLFVVDRMVMVCHIETDERPVGILIGEVAAVLTERRKRAVE